MGITAVQVGDAPGTRADGSGRQVDFKVSELAGARLFIVNQIQVSH